MNILVTVSSSGQFSSAPSTAILSFDQAAAKLLLALHRAGMAFRKAASEAGAASDLFDVSIGSGDQMPKLRLVELELADDSFSEQEQAALLPESFDDAKLADEAFWRVECHRVQLDSTTVRFAALDKHNSDTFTTADINLEVFQAIAEGCAPDLEVIELAAGV